MHRKVALFSIRHLLPMTENQDSTHIKNADYKQQTPLHNQHHFL
jgi:hypothetical protein